MPTERHRLEGVGYPYAINQMEGPEFGTRLHSRRWSNDIKPLAKTASCQAPHFQYHVAGRIAIRMDDGTEFIAGPGDITSLPQGHDAWVVGNEAVVLVDWFGATNYAKKA